MISGYYQQPINAINTGSESVSDTVNGILLPARENNLSSASFAKLSNDTVAAADKLRSIGYYTTDSVWNSGSNFLEDNPLTIIKPPASQEVIYGITVKPPLSSENGSIIARRQASGEDWLTIIMLLVVILFSWISVFYGKYFTRLKDAVMNYQISTKFYDERNTLYRRVSVTLDAVYLLVMAIFLYSVNSFYEILAPGQSSIYYLMIIFAVVAVYAILRIIILRFTGFVFDIGKLLYSYIHQMSIYNRALGIVMFPISLSLLFIPQAFTGILLYAGMAIFSGTIILKAVRALKIIMWKDVLFLYMILYLCTLEILPLLLGYKFLKSLILSY